MEDRKFEEPNRQPRSWLQIAETPLCRVHCATLCLRAQLAGSSLAILDHHHFCTSKNRRIRTVSALRDQQSNHLAFVE